MTAKKKKGRGQTKGSNTDLLGNSTTTSRNKSGSKQDLSYEEQRKAFIKNMVLIVVVCILSIAAAITVPRLYSKYRGGSGQSNDSGNWVIVCVYRS